MSTKTIKVLLVDDHAVVRLGMKTLIEKNSKMIVCGEAETLKDAYQKLVDHNPSIILLDIKLPDGSGLGACKKIKKDYPNIKVIILTAYAENHIIIESIKAGADGFLLKNAESHTIITAIDDVINGKSVLDHSVTDIVFNRVKDSVEKLSNNLTLQDQQILEYICLGKTNKEIGGYLNISEKTVRNYVSKILMKIGVVNRTEAAVYWHGQISQK